jgi:hypothetical protein
LLRHHLHQQRCVFLCAQASPTRPTGKMSSTTRWWTSSATPTARTASVSTTPHSRMMLRCCQPYSCVPSLCAEYWKQIVSVAAHSLHTINAVPPAFAYALLA